MPTNSNALGCHAEGAKEPVEAEARVAQAKSWRDVLRIHPAAEVFPRLGGKDLEDLRASIKENGIQTPVILWSDPLGEEWLLDGRERLDAAESVGIKLLKGRGGYLFPWSTPESHNTRYADEPAMAVLAANIHRRHLTPVQKAELVAQVIVAAEKLAKEQAERVAAEDAEAELREAEDAQAAKGNIGNAFPKSPKPVGRPKNDAVAKVVAESGVSTPTARKVLAKARGEEPKAKTTTPKKPPALLVALQGLSYKFEDMRKQMREVTPHLDYAVTNKTGVVKQYRTMLLDLRDMINDHLSKLDEQESKAKRKPQEGDALGKANAMLARVRLGR